MAPKNGGKNKILIFWFILACNTSLYTFSRALITNLTLGEFGLKPSHNIHGQKIAWVGCAPFFGGAGSPSNTKSSGPRPTSILSGILIHQAVWPQRTWPQIGGCAPFGGKALGPQSLSNTMWPGRGLPPRQVSF